MRVILLLWVAVLAAARFHESGNFVVRFAVSYNVKPALMPLDIQHREVEAGIVVIAVAGRIMIGDESARIEATVVELLGRGHRKLVFDLAEVTHIDSTGIGRFIASLNKVFQAGGKLHMAAATNTVRGSFHVTRLDTVF